MIFHFFKMKNPEFLVFPISIGYGGVDMFFFISGLGLYYSWKKNNDLKSFYQKRLIRIIPSFWIVVLLFDIITHQLSLATISRLSTLGLWLPIPSTYWFISAILFFYLLFPFYMRYYIKFGKSILLFCVVLGVFLMSIYTFFVHSDSHRYDIVLFLSRIPIFFIGVTAGELAYEGKKLSFGDVSILTGFSVFALLFLYTTQQHFGYYYLQNTGMQTYPFVILAPSICLLTAYCLTFMKQIINNAISFCGNISLELYLIHIALIKCFSSIWICQSLCECIFKFLILLFISIASSYILHLLVKMITCKVFCFYKY